MASQLERYLDDHLSNLSPFRPEPYYQALDDSLVFYVRNVPSAEKRVDSRLTLFVSQDDPDEVVGYELYQFSAYIKTEGNPQSTQVKASDIAEAKFHSLARQWKQQSGFMSSVSEMSTLRPYQEIIGMGKPAIPLILKELTREPDHWFWALQAITGEDPIAPEHAGNLEAMAQDWLQWGKSHGQA